MDISGFVLVESPDAQMVVLDDQMLFASAAADGEGKSYVVVQPSNASAQPSPTGQIPPVQADKGSKPIGTGGGRMLLITRLPEDLGENLGIIASSRISKHQLQRLMATTPPGKYWTVQLDVNAPAVDFPDV